MFRNLFKIAVAVLFLLLLGVPLAFYRFGYRGAERETVLVFLLFAVTAFFGHWWMKQLKITDSQPTSLDDRILIGLAITAVYLVLGYGFLLGFNTGVILNGLQTSILAGLFGSRLRPWGWSRWERNFWKMPKYLPVMALMATAGALVVAVFWNVMGWWSLLLVPGYYLGSELGELIGRSVRQWLLALKQVWNIARRMGPPIGAFALGYFVITVIFADLFAAVWRADSAAFKGLSEHPTLIDFAYYSVVTISTTGYGDIMPQSRTAKALASGETLIGLAWTLVIFAAVMMVVQRQFQPPQDTENEPDHPSLPEAK